MTFKNGGVLFICDEPSAKCEMCGNIDELRPYGPHGENICFDCGMKDEATTSKMFFKRMRGEGDA